MAINVARRKFIAILGSAAAVPLSARAQQTGKLPTIGFLGNGPSIHTTWTAAFVERMRELGWIEDRTVAIEYRWSLGRRERIAEIAAEFVCQKVDVIVAYGGAVGILKRATATIPIVFAIATDPVGSGLVASLAQPGGNVTGSSNQGADVAGKRIELLRAILPRLRRLAIMFDAGYPGAVLESGEVQAAARKLGLEVASHEIRRSEDIEPVFDALKGQADALYLVENDLVNLNSERLGAFALSARLPTISNSRNMVEAGGLMSYGPNFPALFRRAAEFVDKILRGTKPRELPVEQPTKFDLVINLKIAKTLGLTIPESFLSLADEVIE